MKKLLNDIENVANEMCEGIVKAYPELKYDSKYRIIKRKYIENDKVSLISGGGSGHEPAHAGFVGKGMLTAAVCGDVFASPSTIQVYNAILQTKSAAGTIMIIKNYSGDVMNFEAAAEMAEEEEIDVRKVYVNDDIAVKDSLYTIGRRGVAGTIFVHKIAGAAAQQGKNIDDVERIANKVIKNVKSIGFAFTSCTVPAKTTPTFQIEENKIEFGVGIHGEPGIERGDLQTSKMLAYRMCDMLVKEMDLKGKDRIALLVNGLGGTPLMELFIVNNDIHSYLNDKKINVDITYVGNYMTSLEMAGASITFLKLDEELKSLLDYSSDAPAFKQF
jgi:dihydroxyacetone kinase